MNSSHEVLPLSPQHSLWGEWLLEAYEDACLRVSQRPRAAWKEVGRQTLTTAMALGIACALTFSLYASPWESGWLSGPLVALFVVVALLGLLGVLRALRLALTGVRLEVDVAQQTLWAMPVPKAFFQGYCTHVQRYGFGQLQAVVLYTYRQAGAELKSNRAMCELVLELKDGQALQGPDVWAEDALWASAQARLRPLAEAIAHMTNLPLQLKEAPLPAPARPPFAFFRREASPRACPNKNNPKKPDSV